MGSVTATRHCLYPEDDKRERTEFFAAQAAAWLADDLSGGTRFLRGGSLSMVPPFRLRHDEWSLLAILKVIAEADRSVGAILKDAKGRVGSLNLAADIFAL